MTFWSGPWDPKGSTPAVPMNESEFRVFHAGEADGYASVGSLTLSNSNGTVTLSGAYGRIQGVGFIQSGSDSVTIDAVPAGQKRIDYAVLRLNPTNNTVSLQKVIGTPAVSNTQEPLLEPQRSGSSLLTGPLDIPVARFTGEAGTAADRGTSMRNRLVRTHFLENLQQAWAYRNPRHGDIQHRPGGSHWFDSGAGSSGQWARIYHDFDRTGVDEVEFNSNGIGQIVHNLGFTPVWFEAHAELNSTGILIAPYAPGPHDNESYRIRAWRIDTGGVFVGPISRVHWHAKQYND